MVVPQQQPGLSVGMGLHTPEDGVIKETLRLVWRHFKDPWKRKPHLQEK